MVTAPMIGDEPKIRMCSAMVSGLGSHVQLLSTKLALKAIEEQQAVTQELPALALANTMPSDESSVNDLPQAEQPSTKPQPALSIIATTAEPEVAYITSAAFMGQLKVWLTELSNDSTTAAQGKAMLQALASHTLKVFDPVEGIVVKAWDIDALEIQDKHCEKMTPIGWSQFLNQHVKRHEGASYAKNADGSFIDITSGESAMFGPVGSNYFYFTWR